MIALIPGRAILSLRRLNVISRYKKKQRIKYLADKLPLLCWRSFPIAPEIHITTGTKNTEKIQQIQTCKFKQYKNTRDISNHFVYQLIIPNRNGCTSVSNGVIRALIPSFLLFGYGITMLTSSSKMENEVSILFILVMLGGENNMQISTSF